MKNTVPALLATIWLASVGVCLGVLSAHDHKSGSDVNTPIRWPAQSKIPRAARLPTLLMFAHPRCPCTRASIGELAILMTHCQNQVNACVVFFRPKGGGKDWLDTDLWRVAEAIPGVVVRADEDGQEAGFFQATTSGHVVLYDTAGQLLFSGGITSARGHSGDNAGRADITNLLHHKMADGTETPVFGCSLLDPTKDCQKQETAWTP